ncbi:putative receptor protein kinase ZmPK1 [Tanacetum coccineum]
MPRIKADIPTFSGSLNIEDFLDWVSETEKYFKLMDIPEDSQVKYVAYKLRVAASSWWDHLQTGHRRQQKQPIRTWRKMKRVMFARFLLVDYEQTLYSLYQNCHQSTQTISEYAEEFMRLASRNQLSESDAQQVARFNNGLRYDIQAIVSLQTTWTIDEVVRIALKAEQTIKKQRTEVGHTSNQCRATKRVNLAEGDKVHSKSEDEGIIISPNVVFDDDDDHSEAFLGYALDDLGTVLKFDFLRSTCACKWLLEIQSLWEYCLDAACASGGITAGYHWPAVKWEGIGPSGQDGYFESDYRDDKKDSSLISLSHGSFDVTEGIDWSSKRKFVIVCLEMVVRIPLEGDEILRVHGERTQGVVKTLMNTKVDEPKLSDISIIRDFIDAFPEDLSMTTTTKS